MMNKVGVSRECLCLHIYVNEAPELAGETGYSDDLCRTILHLVLESARI